MLRTIGWGVFCACSWTWCIGMFLPVIMRERYGWWGFLAFAVPNVLGCAGFGYVITSRAMSERLLAAHHSMLAAFSLVTIAFHSYFLTWLLAERAPLAVTGTQPFVPLVLALIVIGAGIAVGHLRVADRFWLLFAAGVYVLSLITFLTVGLGAWPALHAPGARDLSELIPLAPIIAFGFLLCPYLDATFHRARRESPSRHAFAVFGLTFSVMIVLTLFLWFAPEGLRPLGYAHLFGQSIFTVAVHTRELREAELIHCPRRRSLWLGVVLLAGLLFPAVSAIQPMLDNLGEDFYLRFLVFYGLLFPGYVLVFMSTRRWAGTPTRRALLFLIAGAGLLAPSYELGFIHHQTTWLLAPLTMIVLILALGRLPSTQTTAPAA